MINVKRPDPRIRSRSGADAGVGGSTQISKYQHHQAGLDDLDGTHRGSGRKGGQGIAGDGQSIRGAE